MEDHDVGPMSWDAARDLARSVGAIGAHSLRHAILTCETKPRPFPQRKSYSAAGEMGLEAGAQTVMTTEPM